MGPVTHSLHPSPGPGQARSSTPQSPGRRARNKGEQVPERRNINHTCPAPIPRSGICASKWGLREPRGWDQSPPETEGPVGVSKGPARPSSPRPTGDAPLPGTRGVGGTPDRLMWPHQALPSNWTGQESTVWGPGPSRVERYSVIVVGKTPTAISWY